MLENAPKIDITVSTVNRANGQGELSFREGLGRFLMVISLLITLGILCIGLSLFWDSYSLRNETVNHHDGSIGGVLGLATLVLRGMFIVNTFGLTLATIGGLLIRSKTGKLGIYNWIIVALNFLAMVCLWAIYTYFLK